MGVTALGKLISKYMHKVSLNKYAGKRIGIDAGIIMRGLKFGLHEDDPTFLVRGYHFFQRFLALGMLVVLVNDGPSPPWKGEEQLDRAEQREQKRAVIKEAQQRLKDKREQQARFAYWKDTQGGQATVQPGEQVTAPAPVVADAEFSPEELARFLAYDESLLTAEVRESEAAFDTAVRNNIICRSSDFEQLARLAKAMKIQSIFAPFEADYVLGALARQGLIDLAWSKDGDMPCHRIPLVLRGKITDVDEWMVDTIEEYVTSEILDGLELDMEQFIDLCYVLGNDYCKGGLPGLGPVEALKAIKDRTAYPTMRDLWEKHPLRPKPLPPVVEPVPVATDNAVAGTVDALMANVDAVIAAAALADANADAEAPPAPKKRKAPTKPRARKLKPGEVEKTPEELAAEAQAKADKLVKQKERLDARRIVWDAFYRKYEWSKEEAFSTRTDHLYQLERTTPEPYDTVDMVAFFLEFKIDFLSIQPRRQWTQPAPLYRASDPTATAVTTVAVAIDEPGAAPGAIVVGDDSPGALLARAMAGLAEYQVLAEKNGDVVVPTTTTLAAPAQTAPRNQDPNSPEALMAAAMAGLAEFQHTMNRVVEVTGGNNDATQ